MVLIEDKVYESLNNEDLHKLGKVRFEYCHFIRCEFSQARLSKLQFFACEFHHCDLSNAQTAATAWQNCKMYESKLLGLDFRQSHMFNFSIGFDQCDLDSCLFQGMDLNSCSFTNCKLYSVDFSNCKLEEVTFSGSNLLKTEFNMTLLKGADLRNTTNLSLDPEENFIEKMRIDSNALSGLLGKYKLRIVELE